MKKINARSRLSVVIYWILILALLGLFFTNDFGLVDIHKTSLITAIGLDTEEDETIVTAQLAVPQPSPSGDNVSYVAVQGRGSTLADALSEINAKTGLYPKLQFCKLILLGKSCQQRELFKTMGCLYRKDYSELTALVAMYDGKASDIMAMPTSVTDQNSMTIQRVLTEELKKTANVSAVNLKSIAEAEYSASGACYMPFVEQSKAGTSSGGDDNAGGESSDTQNGSGGSGGQSGSSGGGSGSGSGESGGSGGNTGEPTEFTARRTALFSKGMFAGILDDKQSFVLDVMKNEVRLAVFTCDVEGTEYTLGIKSVKSDVDLKIEGDKPVITFKFKAKARIRGIAQVVDPAETMKDDMVSPEVLKSAEDEIKTRFTALFKTCKETDSDVLGVKELLRKRYFKKYEQLKDSLLNVAELKFDINIKSVN